MKRIKDYLEYCKAHPEFCAALKGIDDDDVEAKIREAGFDITLDELREGMRELRIDDMGSVAGGRTCWNDYMLPNDIPGDTTRSDLNGDGKCRFHGCPSDED